MTQRSLRAGFWAFFAVWSILSSAAFSQPAEADQAATAPQSAPRDVFQAAFDTPDQRDLDKLGLDFGDVEIRTGVGNPGRAIGLFGSARFEFTPPIPTRRGFTYQVSWDCRTQDVDGMALAALTKDNWPEPVDGTAQGGTTDWKRHEFVFAGDGQPAALSLMLRDGGTAWFDNLLVREFEAYPKRSLLDADNCAIVKQDAAATAWVNYPVEKIFPDDTPPQDCARISQIEIDAAGNERVAFQLAITPAEKPLAVDLAISDLSGPQVLPAGQWTCHRVAYVDVPAEYINVPFGRPGPNPDPLPRANRVECAKGQNGVFWITVSVPAECKPGEYRGVVTLQGGLPGEIPLRLRVRGFALPETPSVWSQAIYREAAMRLDPRPSDAALDDWLENAKDHRMENTNWEAQLDPNWARIEQGRLELDFAAFDRAWQFASEHGTRHLQVPKMHLRGGRGRQVTVASWMGLEPFSPEFEQMFTEYCRRVGQHLRDKGLLQTAVFYPWDEPAPHEYETVLHICDLIKQGCHDARIYMAGPGLPAPEFHGLVNGWTLNFRRPVADDIFRQTAERARLGDVVGAYGNDRYRIDYPMAWARLWGWTLKKYNMAQTGWFAVQMWGDDPWKNGLPVHSPMVAPMPGAAFLLYPPGGGDSRFVNSIRWEAIADGLQDYEHLALLERLGNARQRGEGTKRDQEIIGQVVGGPGAFQCATEMSRVQRLRRQVDDEIERLAGSESP